MERHHLAEVFEIFKRLHTTAEYPGTGLGLSTCKKAVQLHGGDIWASAEPNKGSVFCFRLPRKAVIRE